MASQGEKKLPGKPLLSILPDIGLRKGHAKLANKSELVRRKIHIVK
jgi:hypothetical protein